MNILRKLYKIMQLILTVCLYNFSVSSKETIHANQEPRNVIDVRGFFAKILVFESETVAKVD